MLNINKKISSYNHYNNNTPKYIVLHYTGNKGDTAKNNVDYFFGGNRGASAHYFVDDNSIWQSVEDYNGAWHVGNTKTQVNNRNSIGIEMCCNSSGIVSEQTEANAIELTKYLMDKYNVPISNVTTHAEVTKYGKICPNWSANNWSRWNDFKNKLSYPYKLGWNKSSKGWWYCTNAEKGYYYTSNDGWKFIDNEWYIFDSQGYAYHDSWYKSGDYWYYLKASCAMARNEWLYINDNFYYFGDQGGMYYNCYTPDGYWVDEDGAWDFKGKKE